MTPSLDSSCLTVEPLPESFVLADVAEEGVSGGVEVEGEWAERPDEDGVAGAVV
jgi:hypothetical protein